MICILADLPDDDIQWLDFRAAEQGMSCASVLREIGGWYRRWLERKS